MFCYHLYRAWLASFPDSQPPNALHMLTWNLVLPGSSKVIDNEYASRSGGGGVVESLGTRLEADRTKSESIIQLKSIHVQLSASVLH